MNKTDCYKCNREPSAECGECPVWLADEEVSEKERIAYQRGRSDGFQEALTSNGINIYVDKIEADGARKFAEWLPQHFDLRFSNNPDVWLDEFFNHTREKVLSEQKKENKSTIIIDEWLQSPSQTLKKEVDKFVDILEETSSIRLPEKEVEND